MVAMAVLKAPHRKADLNMIYDYITKVFPYYNRAEKTKPELRQAIQTELARRQGFIEVPGQDGFWCIDPNWKGKATADQPSAAPAVGYVVNGDVINCNHCNFTTPFEVAAKQHIESFHPEKATPVVEKRHYQEPPPPAAAAGPPSDQQLLQKFGIKKSVKIKLAQISDVFRKKLSKRHKDIFPTTGVAGNASRVSVNGDQEVPDSNQKSTNDGAAEPTSSPAASFAKETYATKGDAVQEAEDKNKRVPGMVKQLLLTPMNSRSSQCVLKILFRKLFW